MKLIQIVIFSTSIAFLANCATVTPNELVSARSAYQQASLGPAAQLVPAELHKAHEALAQAEKSFQNDPKSYKTRDLAYVAQRKSELASALGTIASDKASKAKSNAEFQKTQTALVERGKQDLLDAEKRAADDLAADKERKAKQELSDSEKRTATALAELAKLAAVKEEERGLVVTLSGSVLFRSAEAILLPSAREKLDQVTQALQALRERNLIVEGFTDSQGSDAYNQGLSQRRADAVRDYLVQRGYPANRIQSRGNGEASPIAENVSAEGRANNRRVEIIIERPMFTSKN
jgi:outer membrane protein OmpA-like peptidoglycan-associated protein